MANGKSVTVLVKNSPFRGNFCEEAMRASIGLASTIDNHTIKLVFIGDGVWFSLKDIKQKEFLKYIISFKAFSMDIAIEKESLEKLNIVDDKVAEDFKIKSRAEILQILKSSDHVFTF